MFTASLNLEALQKATQGTTQTCATEGCNEPVTREAEHCSSHSKGRAKKPRQRAKKAQS